MWPSWMNQSGTLVPSAKNVCAPGQTVSATWSTFDWGSHAIVTSTDSPETVVLSVNSNSWTTVLPSHSSRDRTNVLPGHGIGLGRCSPYIPDRNIRYQNELASTIRAVK